MNVSLAIFIIFQCFNPALLRVEDKDYLASLVAKANATS